MKTSTLCSAAVKKANSMLGIIRKEIVPKTSGIIMPSVVRLSLKYCVQFWSPHLKTGISEPGLSYPMGIVDNCLGPPQA